LLGKGCKIAIGGSSDFYVVVLLHGCKIVDFLFTGPFPILHSFLEHFHLTCLSRIVQCSLPSNSWCSLPSNSWCQTTLPFYSSGLNLCSFYSSAAVALLGSCNSIHLLASQILLFEFQELFFPGEEIAPTVFQNFSFDFSISVASQHDLQAVLE